MTLCFKVEVEKAMQWMNNEDTQGEGVSIEEGGDDSGFDSNEEDVVPNVEDVSLVDRVFDGAFGGEGDEDFVIGKGIGRRCLTDETYGVEGRHDGKMMRRMRMMTI
ncbi:hypothetical protein Tco_0991677 [Tanacetum coccineum]|uniref:Uncharacterized protein n=1 Tax=Tanacetum coccineum TaxID=301880 RepID=A0ABQ5EZX5_9ASTR